VLVEAELSAGRLFRPFEASIPARFSYFMVCEPARAKERKLAAFRSWITSEIERA
jgi:LysR family glycine cleavage system transcriptional activator